MAPRIAPVPRLGRVLIRLTIAALLLLPIGWPLSAWGADMLTTEPERGQALFSAHCVGCHAGGGNIQRRGKTLRLAALERQQLASPEAIARIAAGGIGQMSGYAKVLGDDGAEAVGQWVWSQAQAGWPKA
ncbi:MAG: c-type cytochrome [Synechococcaceae cyanobacterium ELA739]|jgi:cytochrome c6